MLNVIKRLILFTFLVFTTVSCTVENRKHLDGFHVKNFFKKNNTTCCSGKISIEESCTVNADNLSISKNNIDHQKQSFDNVETIDNYLNGTNVSNIKKELLQNVILDFQKDTSAIDSSKNTPVKKDEEVSEEIKAKITESRSSSYISFYSALATGSFAALLFAMVQGVFDDPEFLFYLISSLIILSCAFISNFFGFRTLKIEKDLAQKNNNKRRALFGMIFSSALVGTGLSILVLALIYLILILILFLNFGPSPD